MTVSAFGLLAVLVRPVVAASPRVVVADLRGKTTISWSGNAAIKLRVPRDLQLAPSSSYRLSVRTGRFVSVRAFENPQPIGCQRDYQQPWCAGIWLDWLRDFEQTNGHGLNEEDPSRDFLFGVNDPPVVRRGTWDLYLFTDGIATLEITAKGLTGAASYRPAGRFAGRALLVAGQCRLVHCPAGPAYPDQRVGGGTFDVGPVGLVQALTYGTAPDRELAPGAGTQELYFVRACQYPSELAPDASSDPRDHPDGCDSVPPSSAKDSVFGAVDETSPDPGIATAQYTAGTYNAHGRVYLGIRASAVGPAPARLGGLLIWLRYGIK